MFSLFFSLSNALHDRNELQALSLPLESFSFWIYSCTPWFSNDSQSATFFGYCWESRSPDTAHNDGSPLRQTKQSNNESSKMMTEKSHLKRKFIMWIGIFYRQYAAADRCRLLACGLFFSLALKCPFPFSLLVILFFFFLFKSANPLFFFVFPFLFGYYTASHQIPNGKQTSIAKQNKVWSEIHFRFDIKRPKIETKKECSRKGYRIWNQTHTGRERYTHTKCEWHIKILKYRGSYLKTEQGRTDEQRRYTEYTLKKNRLVEYVCVRTWDREI